MLSISKIQSSSAAKYFESVDYYIDGAIENQWYGKGAKDVGLQGEVQFKKLEKILEGKLPNGQAIACGYGKDGKLKHNPGYDLTFSAPKSVSILALVAKDYRLIKAHQQAVLNTLDYIEEQELSVRLKKEGAISVHKSGNMLASLHMHTDSRELDPNLHTHALVTNISKYLEKYRAIYSQNLYDLKMDMGLYYRNELATHLAEIGYDIDIKSKHGLFEIQGVDNKFIKLFSKRRQQIENKMQQKGVAGPIASQVATLDTRESKRNIGIEEAEQIWQKEILDAGLDQQELINLVEQSLKIGKIEKTDLNLIIKQALAQAVKVISNSQDVFTVADLQKSTKNHMLGVKFDEKIFSMELEKNLDVVSSKGLLTTRGAINREREILSKITLAPRQWKVIGFGAKILASLSYEDRAQRNIAHAIFKSDQHINIIKSFDKTHLYEFYKNFSKATSGLCYTHHIFSFKKERDNFSKETGLNTKSLASFINYVEKLANQRDRVAISQHKNIWVVHQTAMLDAKMLNRLLQSARTLDAKIHFAHVDFANTNINSFPLQKIEGLVPVHLVGEARGFKAEEKLGRLIDKIDKSHSIEEHNKGLAIDNIANWYAERYGEDATVIVANSKEKIEIISSIRNKLKSQEVLKTEDTAITSLQPIYMKQCDKVMPANYIEGNIVKFDDKYWDIVSVNAQENKINLATKDEIRELKLNKSNAKKIKIFRKDVINIAHGDKLVVNSKEANTYTLSYISKHNNFIELIDKQGNILNLATNTHNEIDYAYTATFAKCPQNAQKILYSNGKHNLDYQSLQSLSCKVITPDKHEFKQYLKANSLGRPVGAAKILEKAAVERNNRLEMPTKSTKIETPSAIAIEKSVNVLAEQDGVFCQKHALSLASEIGIRREDLSDAFNSMLKSGDIVSIGGQGDNRLYTTYEMLSMESSGVKLNQQGLNAVKPIVQPDDSSLLAIANNSFLSDGQKQAIANTLSSAHQFTAVHGVPGSGKTTILKEIKRIGRENGYDFIGIASTAAARENIEIKTKDNSGFIGSGISSQTVAKFIKDTEKLIDFNLQKAKIIFSNKVLLIDEASTLSIRENFKIKNIVRELGIRAVSIGDTKQQQSILSGKQFEMELAHGMPVSIMSESMRFKRMESLERVNALYSANIEHTFDIIKDNIKEIPDYNQRLDEMAKLYVSLPKEQCMAMTPLNIDRQIFNHKVRELLKKSGELSGKESFVYMMKSKDIPASYKTDALAYNVGEYLKFNSSIQHLNISAKDYCQVVSVTTTELKLQLPNGNSIIWQPSHYATVAHSVEVYNRETKKIMPGDIIRWRKNDAERGIINSHIAKVTDLGNCKGIFEQHNGDKLQFSLFESSQKPISQLLPGDLLELPKTSSENEQVVEFKSLQDDGKSYKIISEAIDGKEFVHTVPKYTKTIGWLKPNCKNSHFDYNYGLTSFAAQGPDKKYSIANLSGINSYATKVESLFAGQSIITPDKQQVVIFNKYTQAKGCTTVYAKTRADEQITFTLPRGKGCTIEAYANLEIIEKHPIYTNLPSLLVMASRGDNFTLLVDNIDTVKAALQANIEIKQSALQLQMGDKWGELKNKFNDKVNVSTKDNLRENTSFNHAEKSIGTAGYLKEEINQKISHNIEGFVSTYLGKPVYRSNQSALWPMGNNRKKGNLSVELAGPKAGFWYDFRSGKGGRDLISFFMEITGQSYKEARDSLANNFGVFERRLEQRVTKKNILKDEQIAKQNTIRDVRKLYKRGVDIKGTLGEIYFKKYRGINAMIPQDFKFQARCYHYQLKKNIPAILIPARDQSGKIVAINRIYLNKNGSKLQSEYVTDSGKIPASPKLAKGIAKGATIDVAEGKKSDICYIAEGVENALTAKETGVQDNIKACISINNLDQISIGNNIKTIVIIADNDGQNQQTKAKLEATINSYLNKGLEVKIVMPICKNDIEKQDLNDVLLRQGATKTRELLQRPITINKDDELRVESKSMQSALLDLQQRQQQRIGNFEHY